MTRFMREHGFEDYASLWRWSVDDIEGFWGALWRFFAVGEAPSTVLASRAMPGAEWFPGTRLNYAAHLFRDRYPGQTAIVHASELREQAEWSWGDLRERTAAIAGGLRALGVGPGDRVAATSRTCRTRSPRSWPAPRSARSGRAARPTSAPAR